MKQLAVFDVDGTIFRSSLLIRLVERLIEEEIFPAEARGRYVREHQAWLDREGSYQDYINAVVGSFMFHIKGVHYTDFYTVAKVVVAEEQRRVYRYTRDLLGQLKGNGYYLLAVSQSPKTVLDEFCRRMGFDKVYGRIYEIGAQDRFTGVVVDEHLISNKATILRRAVEREGLSLEGSVGVGDTEDDIAFLELVVQPICFNPNAGLYRHAKRMGWKVVVERKDVIYHL